MFIIKCHVSHKIISHIFFIKQFVNNAYLIKFKILIYNKYNYLKLEIVLSIPAKYENTCLINHME